MIENSIEHLRAGGAIMLILYCVCFYLWFLMLKKYFFLKKQRPDERGNSLFDKVFNTKNNSSFNDSGCMFYNALAKAKNSSFDILKNFTEESVRMIHVFNKDLKLINALIVITPLLGLLGTVSGMIKTFEDLNYSAAGEVSFSEGIKQALFTTELGLTISIPSYFFFHRLKRNAGKLEKKIMNIELLLKHKFGAVK